MSGTNTREQLILTAERLFAESGIASVSMRQIGSAAGQRNHSAIQYHFGSKDALVRAIFAYRMEAVNRRRLEMLEQAGPEPSLRALVEAFVYPLAEQLDNEGSHYVRFLSQVAWRPEADAIGRGDDAFTLGLRTVMERIDAHLDLPRPIATQRLRFFSNQVVHAIADRERRMTTDLDPYELPTAAAFAASLVDWVVGGLMAPVSEAAERELESGASSVSA